MSMLESLGSTSKSTPELQKTGSRIGIRTANSKEGYAAIRQCIWFEKRNEILPEVQGVAPRPFLCSCLYTDMLGSPGGAGVWMSSLWAVAGLGEGLPLQNLT